MRRAAVRSGVYPATPRPGAFPTTPRGRSSRSGPALPLPPDVRQLVVHPAAGIGRVDDRPKLVRPLPALVLAHRQGAVDHLSLLLDVEGVDAEGARAQLLVGA